MIPPDAHRLRLGQKTADFFDPLAHLEHVAEDDDPIHMLLAEAVQSGPQELDLFVDVGDKAESHRVCSVIWSTKRSSLSWGLSSQRTMSKYEQHRKLRNAGTAAVEYLAIGITNEAGGKTVVVEE